MTIVWDMSAFSWELVSVRTSQHVRETTVLSDAAKHSMWCADGN